MDRYTDDALTYSAHARCRCGAGLAYPADRDARGRESWVCSLVLRDGVAEEGHDSFPFAFYEVKSEHTPSAHGASTRPADAAPARRPAPPPAPASVAERDGNMTVWSKARVDRLKTWCIHCGSQCSGSAYFCSVGCDESFKGDYPSVPITRDPQRQTPAMGDPGAESPPGDAGKFNTANIVTSANNDGVTITRTITWDRVRDILCNALEGGSNYWYHIKKFVEPPGGLKPWKDEKRTFRHLDCPLSEGGAIHVVDAGEEEEDREVYVVNRESLARAIRLMAEKFPAYLEEIIEENDDGDTGDCLLQLACFGEMRLG